MWEEDARRTSQYTIAQKQPSSDVNSVAPSRGIFRTLHGTRAPYYEM
jgi:hypothetical protein